MFEWKEAYSVKIQSIDEQHKQLLNIGTKAEKLLSHYDEDKYDMIVSLINELTNYTIYHFASEEKILERYNYPDIEQHKIEHIQFIEHLKSIDLDQIDLAQEEAITELLSFVAKWIFKHIMNTDFGYSDFIINAMDQK